MSLRTSPIAIRSGMSSFSFLRWIKRLWATLISLDFPGIGPKMYVSFLIASTPSGSSLMSNEICGLFGVLHRSRSNWSSFDRTQIRAAFAMPEGTNRAPSVVGGPEDETEHSREVIASPSIQAQFSDRLVTQFVRRSSFRASGSASRSQASDSPPLILIRDSDDDGASEERWSPFSLSPGSEDETAAATCKRRRSSKASLPGPSRSRFVSEGDGFLFASQAT
ncbi:hypothetical protein YC2023_017991 [Brassica napus]